MLITARCCAAHTFPDRWAPARRFCADSIHMECRTNEERPTIPSPGSRIPMPADPGLEATFYKLTSNIESNVTYSAVLLFN